MSLGDVVFRGGRKIGKHPLAGRLFCLTERLLPIRRIARTDGLVAFHHPRPIADPHVLIVPTRPFPALISPHHSHRECADVLWSMLTLARQVSGDYPGIDKWTLIINGGIRQEIGQMHGHLLAANSDSQESTCTVSDPGVDPAGWELIHSELEDEARIPTNGYSLVFRWDNGSQNTASWAIDKVNV